MTANHLYYSPLASDPDVSELVELFVESMPQRVTQLEASFTQCDWASLHRAAHQLKGATGSYGFPQLVPKLCDLEVLASKQVDLREIALTLTLIREMSGRMRSGQPGATSEQPSAGPVPGS